MQEDLIKISAKEAARELGYAPEYVAYLCRSTKLKAERGPQGWSIDRSSLEKYKRDVEEQKALRAKTLSREWRKESRETRTTQTPVVTPVPVVAVPLAPVVAEIPTPELVPAPAPEPIIIVERVVSEQKFFWPQVIAGALATLVLVVSAAATQREGVVVEPETQSASVLSAIGDFFQRLFGASQTSVPFISSNVPSTAVVQVVGGGTSTTTIVQQTRTVVERAAVGNWVSPEALALILGETTRTLRSDITQIVGDSISGSLENFSGGGEGLELSDLTDTNIPDTITASNYLLLTGGTLSGTLSVAGLSTLANISAANATTTALAISTLTSTLLKTDASGNVIPAVAGTDYLTSSNIFSYPFPSNATSTLLTFSGGLLSLASTTIGDGTATGGLTVSGGATTTGNAYFAGNVGIGTTSPTVALDVAGYINTGTTFGYQQAGNTILFASSTIGSVLVGQSAGAGILTNATSSTILSGFGATVLGYQALRYATSSPYSTAIGYQSLGGGASVTTNNSNTTGGNTAVGFWALASSTTSKNNTAVGARALRLLTTGEQNNAFGVETLSTVTTGIQNSAFGHQALQSNTASQNSAFGGGTLNRNSSGSSNSAFGVAALYNNLTSSSNSAFGAYALFSGTGANNTAVGASASYNNTSGANNSVFGSSALQTNITGGGNTAIGYQSAFYNNSAISTVSIGYQAAKGTGTYHAQNYTVLGYQAGVNMTTGADGNTFLGFNAGSNITTGWENIIVGNSNALGATPNKALNIGNLLFGGDIASSTTLSTGRIGIGSTSPFARFSIHANNDDTNRILFAIGSSTQTATTTLFSVDNTGNVGIGTSTPWRTLSVNGSSDLGTNALAGYFTANTSTASLFPYASTTAITATTASTTYLVVSSLGSAAGNCLTTDTSGTVTSQSCGGSSFDYLFPSNATSTLLTFSGGLLSLASTTIGGGTALTGLTISGGATTTGALSLGGNLTFLTDNSSNIGASLSSRPRTIYAGTSIIVQGATVNDLVTITSGGNISASSNAAGMKYLLALNTGAGSGAIAVSSDSYFGFNTQANMNGGGRDTGIFRESAGVLSLYNITGNNTKTTLATLLTGTVGIGTTSPFTKLSVAGSAYIGGNLTATGTLSVAGLSTLANISAANATTTALAISTLTSTLLKTDSSGNVIPAVAGTDYLTSSNIFSYPFPSNATSTLLTFSGGLLSLASTTIGDGTQIGGLTISGGATTTGNQYVGGNVSIGTTTGNVRLSVQSTGTSDILNLFETGGSEVFTVLESGNVGIGDTAPGSKLDVAGGINISDTSTGYKIGDTRFFYGSSTSGSTMLGSNAGTALLVSGVGNTAVGHSALWTATSSDYNTAVGYLSLYNNTSGQYNTGTGASALQVNTTGSSNSAFGRYTLRSNTTGGSNTATGSGALEFSLTGDNNTANGTGALNRNLTGSYNTGIGASALYWNQSATNTTAVGYAAANGTGAYSNQGGTYLGYYAGYSAATGSDYNTLLGYRAGYTVTTGQYNTVLGYNGTSGGITTGSNNVLIGNDVRSGLTVTGDNQLNIGNLIFGTGLGSGNTLSTGNVGIGTTTPGTKLEVYSATAQARLDRTTSAGFSLFINSTASANDWCTGLTANSSNWQIFEDCSGASPRLTVATGGNVGIGTTSPSFIDGWTNGLHIAGAIPAIRLEDSDDANNQTWQLGINLAGDFAIDAEGIANLSTVFLIDRDQGNVGIGTTSPSGTLGVAGSLFVDAGFKYYDAGSVDAYIGTLTSTDVDLTFDHPSQDWNIGIDNSDSASFKISASGALGTSDVLTLTTSGNVGIGETTPSARLSVRSDGTSSVIQDWRSDLGANDRSAKISAPSSDSANEPFIFQTSNSWLFRVDADDALTIGYTGNVGILNIAPSVALDVTGSIEYTGTITDVSDERLKDNITPITSNLEKLRQLNPVSFNMIGETSTQLGFLAQNVQTVFPDTVSVIDDEGHLGLDYTQLVAPAIGAIQELNLNLEQIASTTASSTPQSESFASSFFANMFARMTVWLADAGNGIADLFATTIHAENVYAKKLCLSDESGETCVTKQELDALLANVSSSNPPADEPDEEGPTPDPEPPAEEPTDIEQEEVVEEPAIDIEEASSTPNTPEPEPIEEDPQDEPVIEETPTSESTE